MNDQLYIIIDVLLDFNREPCKHYKKLWKPFYLTCTKLSNKLSNMILNKCDVCYFRKIKCTVCIVNDTTSCNNCICKFCNESANFTNGFPIYGHFCARCHGITPSNINRIKTRMKIIPKLEFV
jgi:hypothetical protein